MWLGWPPLHFSFLLLIGFTPWLWVLHKISFEGRNVIRKSIFFTFLFFLVWNILTTWWMAYATGGGAAFALSANALLMTLPVFLYLKTKKYFNKWVGYVVLISAFTSFEYLHLNWDLSWPWLTLGNGFAGLPFMAQWYEYTGALGGSVWIWISNILLFELISNVTKEVKKKTYFKLSLWMISVLIPILISVIINLKYSTITLDKKSEENIVVIQPNIDPYNEKFNSDVLLQVEKMIRLSNQAVDKNTVLLIWPETAISENLDEKNLSQHPSYLAVKDFLRFHPKLKLIAGLNSFLSYQKESEKTATARPWKSNPGWFDVFNSAMLADSGNPAQIYHKSKLVPGAELMPYPAFFRFLEPLALQLGGSYGSLGRQDSPSVFRVNKNLIAAPVICYESIYGGYVGKYIQKGANIITIITNDGWWNNTDGYKQHLAYGCLRAIESRKFIARSANTGISCFISPEGKILSKTNWWEEAYLKENIHPLWMQSEITFYNKHGDYLGKIAAIILGLLMIMVLYKLISPAKKN
ncbi:MAG: apolipoprotein N-acyltransferase [Bacteroidetes bacterium]|nr:apolipoprotein N-acyltransferase [Bacteroidota bacterium]